jgi:hypothetical protein
MLRVLRIIVPNDLGNDEASAVCLYAGYSAGAPPPLSPLISLPLPALERRWSLPALFKYNFVVY